MTFSNVTHYSQVSDEVCTLRHTHVPGVTSALICQSTRTLLYPSRRQAILATITQAFVWRRKLSISGLGPYCLVLCEFEEPDLPTVAKPAPRFDRMALEFRRPSPSEA